MMAVMAGTDWVSSYIDANRLLYGGIGLLTKDTICKPAFYAFSFLQHMKGPFLAKGDCFLMTGKGSDELYILCFHFSPPRLEAAACSDDIDLDSVWQVRYEDERKLILDLTLKNLGRPGEYTIKKRLLNSQSGSILDEWKKLGFETRLNRDDVKYLQAISVPRIEMERMQTSARAELALRITLQPQEVVLLHIYRK